MPLIDRTYFVGEINLPNTNQTAVQENIDFLISKREPELLIALFGYEMYKAFTTGLTEDPIPQRWVDLRDGVDYQDGDVLRHWMGLVAVDGEVKESLIANYVYCWYMRKEATQTSGVGEVATKTENSARVSPMAKQVRAWNEMVDWIAELFNFLQVKKEDYPEWKPDIIGEFDYINAFNL
jgi:hypothetical protein